MFYYLYWDDSAEDNPDNEKIVRAVYNSFDEALAQAEHDIERGKRTMYIEESKELLKASRMELQRGKKVWERD